MAAPPPPPPLPEIFKPISKQNASKISVPIRLEDEIKEAYKKSGLGSLNKNHIVKCRRVKPILQEGPTCGLVALAMLFEHSPDKIIEIARKERFTNNGEMFSCANMEKLTRIVSESAGISVEIKRKVGDINCDDTVEDLLDGAVMLVPYDAFYNHEPTIAKGHKAHWALITGVITSPHIPPVVLARHGKSLRLAAWRLDALAKSNLNLVDVSPVRIKYESSYVVPEGGLAGEYGLCGQYLVVRFI